jgi:3-mercaptopyruvate sulfurtransferase SseA
MRVFISVIALLFTACLLFAACNSQEGNPVKVAAPPANQKKAAPPPPGDNARRITVEELKTALAGNNAIIIDVRGAPAYELGHIKGSKMIPWNEIAAHIDELPRDKTIATYCS